MGSEHQSNKMLKIKQPAEHSSIKGCLKYQGDFWDREEDLCFYIQYGNKPRISYRMKMDLN